MKSSSFPFPGFAIAAGFAAALLVPATASAQYYYHPPRYYGVHPVVVVDRGRPGWWYGNPAFAGYAGPRPGYYFAPGYGYYAVPRGYAGRPFVVGATLPVAMRAYAVPDPGWYGLRPAPPGYAWYYAGTSLVLAAANGAIIQSVAGGW